MDLMHKKISLIFVKILKNKQFLNFGEGEGIIAGFRPAWKEKGGGRSCGLRNGGGG